MHISWNGILVGKVSSNSVDINGFNLISVFFF